MKGITATILFVKYIQYSEGLRLEQGFPLLWEKVEIHKDSAANTHLLMI